MLIAYFEGKPISPKDYKDEIHKGKIVDEHGKKLIVKRGTKKTWHFAHLSGEGGGAKMGRWHKWWENRILDKYLEVRMEDGRHRADFAGNGKVVEFQHSMVGEDVIKKREKFYGDKLIWIFGVEEVTFQIKKLDRKTGKITLRHRRGTKYFMCAKAKTYLDLWKRELIEVTKIMKHTIHGVLIHIDDLDEELFDECLKEDCADRDEFHSF